MIEAGDGTMEVRMKLGLCPSCKTILEELHRDELKVEYKCNTCGLKINDYKPSTPAPRGSL